MERFNVDNEGWMAAILDYYEKTVPAAKQGFYQDYEVSWTTLYKSPIIEPIRLYFGDFSICDENEVLENRFELMEYIQKLVKSEVTAHYLELITGFEYREYQGTDINSKPHKSLIITAEWSQK